MNRGINNHNQKPGMATCNKKLKKLELCSSKQRFSTFFWSPSLAQHSKTIWVQHDSLLPGHSHPSSLLSLPRGVLPTTAVLLRPALCPAQPSCGHDLSSARFQVIKPELRSTDNAPQHQMAQQSQQLPLAMSCLTAGCPHPSPLMMLKYHMDLLTSGLDKSKEKKIALF